MMVLEKAQFSTCLIKLDSAKSDALRPIEVKTDTLDSISIKTHKEVYKTALEKAKRIAEEAEEARQAAEDLEYDSE